jgi:hypothetical protein
MDGIERLDEIERQILALGRHNCHRKDLLKMLKHCEQLSTQMSKETVECRRLRKPTQTYTKLLESFEECVRNLEHHLLMARLAS